MLTANRWYLAGSGQKKAGQCLKHYPAFLKPLAYSFSKRRCDTLPPFETVR